MPSLLFLIHNIWPCEIPQLVNDEPTEEPSTNQNSSDDEINVEEIPF